VKHLNNQLINNPIEIKKISLDEDVYPGAGCSLHKIIDETLKPIFTMLRNSLLIIPVSMLMPCDVFFFRKFTTKVSRLHCSAEDLSPDFRKVRILVNHDGHVHWEPGGVFTTTCDIDIRYFPFDDQSCPIQIGAWAYYRLPKSLRMLGL